MKRKIVAVAILPIACILLLLSACSKAETNFEKCFESVFEITCISESRFESIGTAFKLISGEIITNAHLVSYKEYGEYIEYEEIKIKTYKSSKTINLKVKTLDNEKDIAILEPLETTTIYSNIHGLKAGQVDNIKIGDPLYTIGNLNNYGLCLNKGVLSAKEKQIENNGMFNTYFQTDIEISKGNSGGPVLNSKGEVVGVMSFKLRDSNSEYVDGVSFFIPIRTVECLL